MGENQGNGQQDDYRPGTPPPVMGRSHMDVQTEIYLEVLTDKPESHPFSTQTEAFLDRPPSPLFVPSKNGADKGTQILDSELFDFDLEVTPILDVLVGKTLEVSMLELLEEQELASIRKQQEKFNLMRNAELAELQRLEYEAKRKFAEKQRRKKQEREYLDNTNSLQAKVSAQAFAKTYLSDLRAQVFDDLLDSGKFFDPVERDITNAFLPWLFTSVEKRITNVKVAYESANSLINGSLELALKVRKEAELKEKEELRLAEEGRLAAEAEAAAIAEAAAAEAAALAAAEEGGDAAE